MTAKPELYELLEAEEIGYAIRLQLFALAYNLANFLRSLVLPRFATSRQMR